MIKKYGEFIEGVGEDVLCDEPLFRHMSFKIGGKADLFYIAHNEADLIKAEKVANKLNIPFVLIGSGYNILVSDEGFRGLVIKNEIKNNMSLVGESEIFTDSGFQFAELLSFAAEYSLSGLESLAGIPGSIGGAVFMNAGAYGTAIGDTIIKGRIIDVAGNIKELEKNDFQFGYRTSRLQESNDVLVSVTVGLSKGNKNEITQKMDEIITLRKSKHPEESVPCAGSYFKNITKEGLNERREAAAYYLDKAGVKGLTRGEAAVFEEHANFIINKGTASASDVLELARVMKNKVKEKFDINLENEVRYLDENKGFESK